MNNRFIIMDMTGDVASIWGKTDYEYELHEKLLDDDLPDEWKVIDRQEEAVIADSDEGFYDHERDQLFT